jgi:DNA-3-methyladenine glycosylase I
MSEQTPIWVYKDTRPPVDSQYFENMTRCIFQAGLSWQLMADRWPNFKKAFHGFNISNVASYTAEDIIRLSNDSTIIRNKQKIIATIHNAGEFKRIAQEHGNFQLWLDSTDKGNNYDKVVRNLRSRFKRIGPSTAHIFLWSVGEPIQYDPEVHTRRPRKLV